MEIRDIRPEEQARAGQITVAAFRALMGERLPASYEARLRDVAERVAGAEVLVAVDAGEVVGCVTYVPGPESPYAETLAAGEAGMRMLAVDPERQGRGIGAALARACVDRARDGGRARLVLHTMDDMLAARRIYGSMGFARDPDRDFAPVPGELLRCYVLDLGS